MTQQSIVGVQPSGDTTGADDYTALQAALTSAHAAGGGLVRGQPGATFYLNAELVISSGTELDMTGCTIVQVAGSNSGFVRNTAGTAVHTASDGAVTSGSSTVSTSLGAVAVAGQTLTVAGATALGDPDFLFTGLVQSATATTITVTNLNTTTLLAGATVSGAAVALYNRDANITIRGGYWQAGNNQPSLIGNFCVCHCDIYTVELEGFSSTHAGFCVSVFDDTDGRVTIRNLNTTTTGGDGIHVTGPHYGLVVPEVTGICGDDTVSLTASNFPAPGTGETSGNIIGVKIGVIDTVTLEAAFKVIAGAGNLVDDVVVYGGIRGIAANSVYVGDDASEASTTGGTYGYIDLGNVSVETPSNKMIHLYSPAAEFIRVNVAYPIPGPVKVVDIQGTSTVTIKNLLVSGNMQTTGGDVVTIYHEAPSVTVDHLVMDKFNLDTPNTASTMVTLHGEVTVNQIDLIGCRGHIVNNGYMVYTDSSGAVLGQVNVIGGEYANACLLQYNHTSDTVTAFSGGVTFTGDYVCQCGGDSTKTFLFGPANFTVSGASDASVVWTNGTTCVLQGDGLLLSGNLLHRNVGTETVEVKGPFLPADLSTLTRGGEGDMAYNTNSGLSCGTGPCISSGSGSPGSWKNLFSGSTY